MGNETDRIWRLAAAARRHSPPALRSAEGELLWYRGWLRNAEASSDIVRRAAAKAYQHIHSTPVIDEDELIVGKHCHRQLTDGELRELSDCRILCAPMLPRWEGQESHMAVDYEKLLRLGIKGVREEVRERQAGLDLLAPGNLEKNEFYTACLAALDGVLEYASRYAEHARALAEVEVHGNRRAELLKIASILDKVPAYPAETFREALQSVQFLTFCLEGLYQLGRPDRYLLDYYRIDVENGTLDRASAQELIDCVCVLFNENVPRGLAVGFMAGGRDASGRDICNELTEMLVESVGHTRMIYPGVGLCCTNDMPEELLRKACRLLAEGLSHPALFNDDVITEGLRRYGLPPEEACLYIQSTCVEITPVASSAVWVASPYINLPQLLLDCLGIAPLDGGGDSQVMQFESFDALLNELRNRLRRKVRVEAVDQNRQQLNRSLHGGNPLVSCFVNDCLERGRDVDSGGARYNWIMPSFVGLSNLADSLTAIRRLVFEEQTLSLAELTQALCDDFTGHGTLLHRIADRMPKYGNDDDAADAMVGAIARWITEETGQLTTFRGDRFIPSLFCWIMHEQLGSRTAATPDGRRSAFPLGDGSGPAQGREKKGPTASLLSSTKWEHAPFIGGIAVNMKFNKSAFGPNSLDVLAGLVKTFLERGGFELQVNAVDRETLLKARKDPAAYGDLVVRVGGYSDYFVRLSPSMQDEVIARTEHRV